MPGPKATKLGHALAKGLGIKLQPPIQYQDEVTRGESVFSNNAYVEEPPRTIDELRELVPTGNQVWDYVVSLFPFLQWIGHYNTQWLIGDLVAGITVGAVVVPQGMSYALLANVEPQFGLYSSFMGVLIYWFFATSKDITIGPVAVMSTLTGTIVEKAAVKIPDVPGHVVASALSIIAGSIVLFIGLIRCGWIVDLIPLTSLSAYMTGSAINICSGQVAGLLGESGFNTRAATYKVIINSFKYLPKTKIDAAMGLTALTMLYLIRFACNFFAKRYPKHRRMIFFASTLRTVFVILLYTMISWLVNRHRRKHPLFKILKKVPRGFKNASVPVVDERIIRSFIGDLPATVIVLLIEHIAISKSFGRVNNYTINPSQEMVAIGVANVLGPFLGGYPSTGSFSRTAIKAKAGVRTPFAGVITALVVLLAIYALPPVFFYIPSATLSAVIIHAVGDLITPPDVVYQFWRVNPFEVVIFFVGVFVTIFTTIENGIYSTICISAAMLLYRILRTRGSFLGRVKVQSILGDQVIGQDSRLAIAPYGTISNLDMEVPARTVFLPLDHQDGSNPDVDLQSPYPGVFIYRFAEGFTYPNASHSLEHLAEYVFKHTRLTNLTSFPRPGDRPWNDPGPTRRQLKKIAEGDVNAINAAEYNRDLPTLKAIILDCSSVNFVDVTSVQALIDVRNQLDRYAAPEHVDWHFASISNRWSKRALISAGFGFPTEYQDTPEQRWRGIFSVTPSGDKHEADGEKIEDGELRRTLTSTTASAAKTVTLDIEEARSSGDGVGSGDDDPKLNLQGRSAHRIRGIAIHSLNRPLFHVDLTSALQCAIANVEAREAASADSRPSSIKGL
ncbi:sulfate permease [Grosmannia clavigera kw1407]|uniref:Sulfate permease n=1 Tax=Grosmannia clavigera (strain kw1407 / UAMH 11150) TaxID=655863 RepID=F0XF05_GROCL|nr:sulfate permease [Grosmannia clavigera kw1407]EFX04818.1 sulfate permease [Grosmannia clavigera kw1407]